MKNKNANTNQNASVNTNASTNTIHKKKILIGIHRAYKALIPDETGCYHPGSVDSKTRDFALDDFLEKHLDDGVVKIRDDYYLPIFHWNNSKRNCLKCRKIDRNVSFNKRIYQCLPIGKIIFLWANAWCLFMEFCPVCVTPLSNAINSIFKSSK